MRGWGGGTYHTPNRRALLCSAVPAHIRARAHSRRVHARCANALAALQVSPKSCGPWATRTPCRCVAVILRAAARLCARGSQRALTLLCALCWSEHVRSCSHSRSHSRSHSCVCVRLGVQTESFRTPNFRLVADILDWLVRQYVHARTHAHTFRRAH
ncbi:hypothetical protein EON67_10330 [archaeon]|nr:MAG: hypothetical protein EON67_10330 [archaeon]